MTAPFLFARRTITALGLLSIASFAVPGLAETVTTTEIEYKLVEDAAPQLAPAIAHYGPFRVVDSRTAELVGEIEARTPGDFRRMIAAHPGLRALRLIDCPGTLDDDANLALARMVRHAKLDTHVPAQGSVRSGGVELFLAGVRRTAEPGAEFGVHSWQDSDGNEADDVGANDPAHRVYLTFYRDMGLDDATAQSFYRFTNATPHDDVRYLTTADLSRFGLLN